ncbi:formate dehydrogenase subunit gamma [Acidocella aminolytica]|jgi:formate dehydrogenase subunit gamma|nr:formate dehydrogenase subunit gamma [Acidocella aminolytica]GBQ41672.1 NADH:ubiquinone oxidoreductase 24 kD subunit [Acidocella aminolytica 101 = DSM 11237]SHF45518.1 formate dehydrogenase gamma subunit [Acidocella aminolytica 101 = DSM 11237]
MAEIWNLQRAQEIIARHKAQEGPMLPILHELQDRFGSIGEEAIRLVAQSLNITRAEVYGVVSFYHDFRQAPAGRHVLKICRAEACQSMGGEDYAAALLHSLGLEWGQTTKDGRLTIEPVYCLGLCACAPNAMLDGQPRARLDATTLQALAGEAV